ncbi:hypothetical protein QQP08_014809 [Theobroma cacao]|nr:hypothetical protein QQP08_014809 [Theobroma cacao]
MSEVELLPQEGELLDDPFCWNAYGVEETLTIPPIGCLQEGMPQTIAETSQYACLVFLVSVSVFDFNALIIATW